MDRRRVLTAAVGLTAAGFWLPESVAHSSTPRGPLVAKRAQWFVSAFDGAGLNTVGVGDWSRHNRDHKGRWGPPVGVMIHHTASSSLQGSLNVCRKGRSDLPGPLCHAVIGKDGTVHLIGYGRTNHAGLGDGRVLAAVRRGRKSPKPTRWDTDGNVYFYGFECVNAGSGKDPWPDTQMDAIVKAAAALCRHHGWGANHVVGHKEWQKGKIDPKGFSMNTLRSRIAKAL